MLRPNHLLEKLQAYLDAKLQEAAKTAAAADESAGAKQIALAGLQTQQEGQVLALGQRLNLLLRVLVCMMGRMAYFVSYSLDIAQPDVFISPIDTPSCMLQTAAKQQGVEVASWAASSTSS